MSAVVVPSVDVWGRVGCLIFDALDVIVLNCLARKWENDYGRVITFIKMDAFQT